MYVLPSGDLVRLLPSCVTADSVVPGALLPAGATSTASTAAGDQGEIIGSALDPLIDRVVASAIRQAMPIIRSEILPSIQHDASLQKGIGTAAGAEAGDKLKPFAIAGVALLGVIATVMVVQVVRNR